MCCSMGGGTNLKPFPLLSRGENESGGSRPTKEKGSNTRTRADQLSWKEKLLARKNEDSVLFRTCPGRARHPTR